MSAARWIGTVVVLLATTRTGAADDECTNEVWLKKLTQIAHDLSRQATTAAAQCSFDGANDKLLADFAKRSKRELDALFAKFDEHAHCKIDGFSGQKYAELVVEQLVDRVGLMYAQCSKDARAFVKDLAKQGTTNPDDVEKALLPVQQKYYKTAFPKL